MKMHHTESTLRRWFKAKVIEYETGACRVHHTDAHFMAWMKKFSLLLPLMFSQNKTLLPERVCSTWVVTNSMLPVSGRSRNTSVEIPAHRNFPLQELSIQPHEYKQNWIAAVTGKAVDWKMKQKQTKGERGNRYRGTKYLAKSIQPVSSQRIENSCPVN